MEIMASLLRVNTVSILMTKGRLLSVQTARLTPRPIEEIGYYVPCAWHWRLAIESPCRGEAHMFVFHLGPLIRDD